MTTIHQQGSVFALGHQPGCIWLRYGGCDEASRRGAEARGSFTGPMARQRRASPGTLRQRSPNAIQGLPFGIRIDGLLIDFGNVIDNHVENLSNLAR